MKEDLKNMILHHLHALEVQSVDDFVPLDMLQSKLKKDKLAVKGLNRLLYSWSNEAQALVEAKELEGESINPRMGYRLSRAAKERLIKSNTTQA